MGEGRLGRAGQHVGRAAVVRAAAAVAAALLVSGCNSTTRLRNAVSADEEGVMDAAVAGQDAAGPDTATGVDGVDGTVSRSGPSATGGAGPGRSTDGRSASGRASLAVGQGITDTTIKVGLSVSAAAGTDAALTSLGFEDVAAGDERAATEAILAYLNARGGMAGRKVVPVYREFDSNQNYTAEYAKDCAAFTQDNTVFAVVASMSVPGWEALAKCLADTKTLYLLNQLDVIDQPVFARYAPYLYSPGQLRGDRWGSLIDHLAAASFFDKAVKVGVIRVETSATERVLNRTIKPRLAALGLSVEEAAYPTFYSTGDLGAVTAQMQNIALRFKSSGVTHVMFLASSGTGSYLFTPVAESMQFRPRYGFFSTDGTQALTANAPAEQLRNSLLVGWWPAIDVDWEQDPNDAAGQALCLKIMRDAGVAIPSRLAFQEFSYYCDELFFLKTTLDRAAALTPAGVRAATDTLGRAFVSGITFNTMFGPNRFDGVDAVRLGAFDGACGCFKYQGGLVPAP